MCQYKLPFLVGFEMVEVAILRCTLYRDTVNPWDVASANNGLWLQVCEIMVCGCRCVKCCWAYPRSTLRAAMILIWRGLRGECLFPILDPVAKAS